MPKFVKTDFTIGVHDLMHRPGEERPFERSIVLHEKWGEGLAVLPVGTTLTVSGRLESIHEGILATATVSTIAQAECGRCLDPFTITIEVEFQELFAYSQDEAFDYEVHDDHVDLEPLIRDAVVLALPFQPVCAPDCLGLNPETGERQTGVPGENTTAIDPRWAALAEFTAFEKTDKPNSA